MIARVHALATAAGCQLVAQCDLAVAAQGARFGVNGIDVGLFCATPSVPLSRNMGPKQAMEMLLTGDFISAEEAQRRGLVNRVVAARTRWTPKWPRWWNASWANRARRSPWARHVLPPAGNRHRIGLPAGRPDHGLQHGARRGPGGRAGLHRQARAQLAQPEEPPATRPSPSAPTPAGNGRFCWVLHHSPHDFDRFALHHPAPYRRPARLAGRLHPAHRVAGTRGPGRLRAAGLAAGFRAAPGARSARRQRPRCCSGRGCSTAPCSPCCCWSRATSRARCC